MPANVHELAFVLGMVNHTALLVSFEERARFACFKDHCLRDVHFAPLYLLAWTLQALKQPIKVFLVKLEVLAVVLDFDVEFSHKFPHCLLL